VNDMLQQNDHKRKEPSESLPTTFEPAQKKLKTEMQNDFSLKGPSPFTMALPVPIPPHSIGFPDDPTSDKDPLTKDNELFQPLELRTRPFFLELFPYTIQLPDEFNQPEFSSLRKKEFDNCKADILKGINYEWKTENNFGSIIERNMNPLNGIEPTTLQTRPMNQVFECQLEGCTETFPTFHELGRHQKTHRPYKCPVAGCTASYVRSSDLTKHRRAHYADPTHFKPIGQTVTPEKPLKCNVEGCNASYIRASDLTKHLRIHTEEKPFICSFQGCKSSFLTSADLTKHVKTHYQTGVTCSFPGCGMLFHRISELSEHVSKHHY